MKKQNILIISAIVLIFGTVITFLVLYNKDKNEKIIEAKKALVQVSNNLEVEFLADVKVSDFVKVDGKIIDDVKIDTTKVGRQKVSFTYKTYDNYKIDYSYEINVVDHVAPLIWLDSSYTVDKGSEDNLVDKILCGDNADSKPTCVINGEYDLEKVGNYKLEFKATDESGNETVKKFTLYVREPKKNNTDVNTSTTKFSDVVKAYKNDSTEIGLDISKWQGEVDFKKLKNAGVEFVMIRVGTANGMDGDYVIDPMFEKNIKGANEAGIKVGIYYYSYANSREKAEEDAKWVLEQIKDYKVDLPIAFDWERWGSFNSYELSFFGLSDMGVAFIDVVKKAGYEGILYSSKTYLENMWMPLGYPIWLAHYTKKTNYDGEYVMWQMCSNGRVDGILGDVDIDIRYLN